MGWYPAAAALCNRFVALLSARALPGLGALNLVSGVPLVRDSRAVEEAHDQLEQRTGRLAQGIGGVGVRHALELVGRGLAAASADSGRQALAVTRKRRLVLVAAVGDQHRR